MSGLHTFQLAPGGIQDSIKGTDYQLKLLQMYCLNAFNQDLEFSCWTEDANAGKFDDVIFSYTNGTVTKFQLLQAKQKTTPKRLELYTFFNDKNYHLYKYFDSFVSIEQNFGINYSERDLDELIICTNNSLPQPVNGLLQLSDPALGLSLYLEQLNSHQIFDTSGIKYKFSQNFESENLSFLKSQLLAVELVKLLFESSSTLHLLQYSKKFLYSQVFEINGNTMKFRNDFLNPGSSQTEIFRNLFMTTVNSGFVKFPENVKEQILNDFWLFMSNMPLEPGAMSKILSLTDDEKLIDEKVSTFIKKFVLVSSLEESEIDKNIQRGIEVHFKDPNELNQAYLETQNSIKGWLSNQSGGVAFPINKLEIDKTFQQLKFKIYKSQFENFKQNLFSGMIPIFLESKQELSSFMSSVSPDINDRILIYEVPERETFWGSVRLYQMDRSIVYLTTEFEDSYFEKALHMSKYSTEGICFVVECAGKLEKFLQIKSDFIREVEGNKNVKLVIVCNVKNSHNFIGFKTLSDSEILCGELNQDSLETFLRKDLNFQGKSVKLEDLIKTDQLKFIRLKELEDLIELGTPIGKPDLYFSRTLYRRPYLKVELLKDHESNKIKDVLCFSKYDIAKYLQIKPEATPIHLLEKIFSKKESTRKINSVEKLLWKKSFRSIKALRPYKDESESIDTKEIDLIANLRQMNLIVGIAGMGKSLLLQNIGYELKQKHNNYWVEKIDLRSFFSELEEFKLQNYSSEDFSGIQNFFHQKFMKFDCCLKLEIFKNFSSKGQVVLLFDGFDEICGDFKDLVLNIVTALMKISKENKFLISTRSEWCEDLEENFLQFAHYLHPFSESDQQHYLLSLWNKDFSWLQVSEAILKNLNNSITDKEKSFTGVPLITKLCGEYYIGKLDNEDLKTNEKLQENLLSSNFTLFGLLDHFINKKFEIYFSEKLGIAVNNPLIKQSFRSLKNDHQKLALKILFPTNFHKLISAFDDLDDEVMLEMVRCGLVEYFSGKLQFHHRTTAEFLVVIYFKENCHKKHVFKFFIEIVLVGDEFKLIRSFLNNFIGDIMSDTAVKGLKTEKLLVNALKVAAKESNTETFHVIFELLANSNFLFENFLMEEDENGFILLYHYFFDCEASAGTLDTLNRKFGLKFIKHMLQTLNGADSHTIMVGSARHGKNYLPLIKWIIQNFKEDLMFIKKVIYTLDKSENTILHNSITKFHRKSFFALLDELKKLENDCEEDLLSVLLLKNINRDGKNFFHSLIEYLGKIDKETENLEVLQEVIVWLKINSKVLEEVMNSKDKSLKNLPIHYIAKHFTSSCLNIIQQLYNSGISMNCLKEKNIFGYTFIDDIIKSDSEICIEIFDWLKEVDFELLKVLIYSRNNAEQNLIQRLCHNTRKKRVPYRLKQLVEWLEINIPDFNRNEFFKHRDGSGATFLNSVIMGNYEDDATPAIVKILNWLKKLDLKLLKTIVYSKDNHPRNLIYYYCEYGRSADLPNLLKVLVKWLQSNVPNFDCQAFLNERGFMGESFLYSFTNNNIETEKFIEILDWLKEINLNLVVDFFDTANFYNQRLLNFYCEYRRKKDVPLFLRSVVNWFSSNIPNYNIRDFLTHWDIFGNPFIIDIVRWDAHKEAASALIEVLEFLKEIDFDIVTEFICSRNYSNTNLIFNLCENCITGDIPDLMRAILPWFESNFPNLNCNEFLLEKNDSGGCCIQYLVMTNCTDLLRSVPTKSNEQ